MIDQSSDVRVSVPEDVLSSIIRVLEVAGTVYGRFDLAATWGLRSDPTDTATFHLVDRGAGWLIVDGTAEPMALAGGDLVLCQPGVGHALVDRPETTSVVSGAGLRHGARSCVSVHGGGSGARTTFICGAFAFPTGPSHPLLDLLPPVMHIRAGDNGSSDGFHTVMKLLASETASGRAGSEVIARRLSDVLFIQILRAWVDGLAERTSWLGALRDLRIGAALALVHADPGRPWTVDALAGEVGMSRSTFSELFAELVGEPPMRYISRWRLQVAAQLLRQGELSLAAVADRVGYRSHPGFARVFSREFGLAPGAYRRSHGSAAGVDALA